MITAIIVVILICSALSDWAAAKDWEASEHNAEIRHQELITHLDNREVKVTHRENRTVRTRAIKDTKGNVLIEEVLVEDLEDLV